MRLRWLVACLLACLVACSLVIPLDDLRGADAQSDVNSGDAQNDVSSDGSTSDVNCGQCLGTVIAQTSAQPGVAAIGRVVAWTSSLDMHLVYEDGGAFAGDATVGGTDDQHPYYGEMAAKGSLFLGSQNAGTGSGAVVACPNDGTSCNGDMWGTYNAYRVVADPQGSFTISANGITGCNKPTTCYTSFTEVVPLSVGPFQDLALSATDVYWSTGATGLIKSVSRNAAVDAGPTVTTFIGNQQNTTGLAFDAKNLYWVEFDADKIHSCAFGATCAAPALVYQGNGYGGFTRMVSDGTYLYAVSTTPPAVIACPVGGCAQATLVMAGLQGPSQIALSTHYVVVADSVTNEILVAPRL